MRVLSVGQCSADHWLIERAIRERFPAEIQPAATAAEAIILLQKGGYQLVLVNRVFDADGGSGLEFIRFLKSDPRLSQTPVMLVSNYEQFQSEAVALGAVRGFGKASLADPELNKVFEPILSPPDEVRP